MPLLDSDSREMKENKGERWAAKVSSQIQTRDVVVHGQHLNP